MINLLKLEFFKQRNTKTFWIFSIWYLLFMISVPLAVKFFVGYTMEKSTLGPAGEKIIEHFNIFGFSQLWHNLTWIYKILTILLAFITIVSVTNEYQNRTIRQTIINGLSRNEFLLSKLMMILITAVVVTVVAFAIGLYVGFSWSNNPQWSQVFENIRYLFYYFLYVFNYLLFAFVLAMLIKKSGITIAVVIFYVYVIEPIITTILTYGFDMKWLSNLFPINGPGNLIRNPFTKLIIKENTSGLTNTALLITIMYICFYLFLSWYLMEKKDI